MLSFAYFTDFFITGFKLRDLCLHFPEITCNLVRVSILVVLLALLVMNRMYSFGERFDILLFLQLEADLTRLETVELFENGSYEQDKCLVELQGKLMVS